MTTWTRVVLVIAIMAMTAQTVTITDTEIGIAREVDRLSRDWGLTAYQVSLAWLLSRAAVSSVIVGAETVDELNANATAADVQLDTAQLDALTALAAEPGAFHHRAGDGPEPPAAAG